MATFSILLWAPTSPSQIPHINVLVLTFTNARTYVWNRKSRARILTENTHTLRSAVWHGTTRVVGVNAFVKTNSLRVREKKKKVTAAPAYGAFLWLKFEHTCSRLTAYMFYDTESTHVVYFIVVSLLVSSKFQFVYVILTIYFLHNLDSSSYSFFFSSNSFFFSFTFFIFVVVFSFFFSLLTEYYPIHSRLMKNPDCISLPTRSLPPHADEPSNGF